MKKKNNSLKSFAVKTFIALAMLTVASGDNAYAAGTENSTATSTSGTEAKATSKIKCSSKNVSVKLSQTSFTYTGKEKKPSVTVTYKSNNKKTILKKGTDYRLKYTNNKKIGKGKVTVKFKGAYTGSISKTFTIKPAAPKGLKLKKAASGIKLSWKKVNGASGYVVYRSVKGKAYKKVATVKGNKSAYTDKISVKKDTAYKYKIAAYKKTNGKTIKSNNTSWKIYSVASGKTRTYTNRYKWTYSSNTEVIQKFDNGVVWQSGYGKGYFKSKDSTLYFVNTGKGYAEIVESEYGSLKKDEFELADGSKRKKKVDLNFPDFIDGYPITKLGDVYFDDIAITSVKLPKYLTELSRFNYCKNLETVVMGDKVTEMSGFEECPKLKNINLSKSLKILDTDFRNDVSLTSLELPDSLEAMGHFVNTGMTSITIPAGITELWQSGDGSGFFLCWNSYGEQPEGDCYIYIKCPSDKFKYTYHVDVYTGSKTENFAKHWKNQTYVKENDEYYFEEDRTHIVFVK